MSNINLEKRQKYALLISASLNFILFSAELTVGLIIMSMNLVADSTDMFIDTITYLVAIWAIKKNNKSKLNATTLMGSLQVTLSLILLIFIVVEMSLSSSMEKGPDGYMMLYLSSASLVCNSICLYVLEKNKSKDSNISASIVFSAIDLWANIGSLIAAVLTITISKVGEYPDLIISVFIFILIAIEATKIFINRFKHKDKEINFLD